MKQISLFVLFITLTMMMELSVSFRAIHTRILCTSRLHMFWDTAAQLAKIESDEKLALMRIALEEKRLVSEEMNQKASRELEEKRLVHADANQKASRELEEKRIVHADANQKASRELEEKRLVHADRNQKALRNLGVLFLQVISALSVLSLTLFYFFGRGGGDNVDKILGVAKDFRSEFAKVVLVAQGFGVKTVLQPVFKWLWKIIGK